MGRGAPNLTTNESLGVIYEGMQLKTAKEYIKTASLVKAYIR